MKNLLFAALLLVFTTAVFASTYPVRPRIHQVAHGQRNIYSITFNYCHWVGPVNEVECCTITANYYLVGPVPIVTSSNSNCLYSRTPAAYDHSDEIPQTIKDGTLEDFTKYYIKVYGATEGTYIGDDGHD